MASMFYSLKEVAEKLNKTEEEVKELVKEGKLREFRDGPNLLFKVDEVEGLMADTRAEAPQEISPSETEETSEETDISLAPESEEPPAAGDLREQTTPVAGDGINVLGEETASEYKVADDTMAETKAASGGTVLPDDMLAETKAAPGEASLEEIEEDVNLDTFGSGSGLLDLSLQADDTSLGGILDEIYTPEGEEEKEAKEGSALEVAAEAEELIPAEEIAGPEPAMEAPAMVAAYVESEVDRLSNVLGIMLFVPLASFIYIAIVAVKAQKGVVPVILTSVQGIIWYIVIGVILASLLIVGGAFMLSSQGAKAAVAKPKAKKEKKAKKKKKPKKAKS
ncbi:MAG: hypothetical protein JSV82_04375 [Planctomycetota bacterium]|nr:MAG: hypothetical protein JSV82_04375 [Planctomycetota bacterium]